MKIVSSRSPQSGEHGAHELADWVESYLRDALTNAQRDQFEQALVADVNLQELTRRAYALQELSQEFPEQLAVANSRRRAPLLHYAMAAGLGAALVTVPAWWVQHEMRQEQGALASQLESAQQTLAELARPQAGLAVLRLGATRSSRSVPALIRQAPEVRWAQLQLPMVSPSGGSWPAGAEVLLANAGSEQQWRYPIEDLALSGDVALLFPLAGMRTGRYDVSIVDRGRVLAQYAFELAAANPER